MQRELLERLNRDRAAKLPTVLVTNLKTGGQALFHRGDEEAWPAPVAEAALAALAADRPVTIETEEGAVFLNMFNPPPRLIVVGAVHIAQALVPIAELAGYGVTVIDPRRAFGSDLRFPAADLSNDWPDEAMARLKPDARTAVVTLTHDPKLDDPALETALRSEAFYIGSLGSKKTHAARLDRLTAAGFGQAALSRIHGPIGLPIGAKSPAEVAIAIMAEITQALRQGTP